jgi:hypothetical protein
MQVLRRFPVFEFVVPSAQSVSEAAASLDTFLSHQERPRGFLLADPRVDGVVTGATFKFRRRESGLGGSVAPFVEGYFVPAPTGSNVFVRVQVPAWWWLFDIAVIALCFLSIDWPPNLQSVAITGLVAVFVLALSVGPTWLEARQAEALLAKVLHINVAA